MRLIDADAMIAHFNLHIKSAENARCFSSRDAWDGAKHDLQDAETIDAEPVRHGRWGFLGMDMMAGSRAFYFGTCSECRERINFELKHKNYCSNCGAKMDKEDSK